MSRTFVYSSYLSYTKEQAERRPVACAWRMGKAFRGRICAELPRPILPIMTYETSPFAFRVEAHPKLQGRYLWAIGYGFQTYRRSPLSFATRREAKNDALKAMSKIEAHWRRERDASPATGRAEKGAPL